MERLVRDRKKRSKVLKRLRKLEGGVRRIVGALRRALGRIWDKIRYEC